MKLEEFKQGIEVVVVGKYTTNGRHGRLNSISMTPSGLMFEVSFDSEWVGYYFPEDLEIIKNTEKNDTNINDSLYLSSEIPKQFDNFDQISEHDPIMKKMLRRIMN